MAAPVAVSFTSASISHTVFQKAELDMAVPSDRLLPRAGLATVARTQVGMATSTA